MNNNKNIKLKRWPILLCRFLPAVIFFVHGIDMFIQFMPLLNPRQPGLARRFLNNLHKSGYFYPIVGIVKTITALSLFFNRFLPLMLVVILPVMLNGILFHLSTDAPMAALAIAAGVIQVYLIYPNKEKYLPLLSSRNK